MRRSLPFQEEMKPTVAARITAGATPPVGSAGENITARKIKVSATDFSLSLTPSALLTETVSLLAAKVKRSRPARGVIPVQPVSGKLVTEIKERTKSTEASAATQPRSARVFQFPSGIS